MTITAKNYAAQAQRASIGISAKNSAHKAAIYMARTLPDAQHFALPDGGKVLDDGLRGLEGTDQLRLPFPVISVEWWSEGSRFCVIATEAETKILMMFSLCLDGKNWAVPDAACIYEGLKNGEVFAKFVGPDAEKIEAQPIMHVMALAVLELCEALSCSNVDSEVVELVDQRKNAKRIKQGKLPMYETRRLVIKAPITRGAASQAQGDSDRQGPREHLRRGHIRRLQDGRRIWVQSCVVGSRENGVIHKSYAVVGVKEAA